MRAAFLILASAPLWCEPSAIEETKLCLSLHDTRRAHDLLEQLQAKSNEVKTDPTLLCLLFDYFAENQDTEGLRSLWDKTQATNSLDKATAEHIAWVNIETASQSYHPKLRAEALLAAAGSQDVHGVRILTRMLNDGHLGIQLMALELACHYPDEPIQRCAEAIAQTATPEARVAAARLLALQKAPCADKVLHAMLLDDTLSDEDHVIVASYCAQLQDRINLVWLQKAVTDPKASIRALGAISLRAHPTAEGLRLLLPLLFDASTSVRRCVFETFGLWQSLIPDASDQLIAAWRLSLQSPIPSIAATSAWGELLSTDEQAKQEAGEWFERTIQTGTKEQSLCACGRLIKTGPNGLFVATKLLSTVKEPLCKLNLASYLLLNRTQLSEASEALRTSLPSILLGQEHLGLFEWIGASSTPHHPGIPRLPESEDLFIRLQLAALRRYAGQPVSKEEVEHLLNDRGFGVCAATSLFVAQEFATSLNEVLTPLLTHETESIRIQAALLLTIVSQSSTAATVLAEQYAHASREGKEALILGFSCLPLIQTTTYLIPLLFDPSPAIRTRASGALIASMYK